MNASAHYEVRVEGRVGEAVLASFDGVTGNVRPATTVLRARLDQSAFQGVLERLLAADVELVEIRRIAATG